MILLSREWSNAFLTFTFCWPQLGHEWPWLAKSCAWIWPTIWRPFISASHLWISSVGKSSQVPDLHFEKAYQFKMLCSKLSQTEDYHYTTMWLLFSQQKTDSIPEMFISRYCLITPVAEVLPTIVTNHLIATFSSRYSHLTRRALFRKTIDLLHTKKLINHICLTAPLFSFHWSWILATLMIQSIIQVRVQTIYK